MSYLNDKFQENCKGVERRLTHRRAGRAPNGSRARTSTGKTESNAFDLGSKEKLVRSVFSSLLELQPQKNKDLIVDKETVFVKRQENHGIELRSEICFTTTPIFNDNNVHVNTVKAFIHCYENEIRIITIVNEEGKLFGDTQDDKKCRVLQISISSNKKVLHDSKKKGIICWPPIVSPKLITRTINSYFRYYFCPVRLADLGRNTQIDTLKSVRAKSIGKIMKLDTIYNNTDTFTNKYKTAEVPFSDIRTIDQGSPAPLPRSSPGPLPRPPTTTRAISSTIAEAPAFPSALEDGYSDFNNENFDENNFNDVAANSSRASETRNKRSSDSSSQKPRSLNYLNNKGRSRSHTQNGDNPIFGNVDFNDSNDQQESPLSESSFSTKSYSKHKRSNDTNQSNSQIRKTPSVEVSTQSDSLLSATSSSNRSNNFKRLSSAILNDYKKVDGKISRSQNSRNSSKAARSSDNQTPLKYNANVIQEERARNARESSNSNSKSDAVLSKYSTSTSDSSSDGNERSSRSSTAKKQSSEKSQQETHSTVTQPPTPKKKGHQSSISAKSNLSQQNKPVETPIRTSIRARKSNQTLKDFIT